MNQSVEPSLKKLFKRIHQDERGAVSLETILVVAAIAIPVILFVYKIGWPKIQKLFTDGITNLQTEAGNVSNGTSGN
jgi:Flp pilus assembly pilin Flp